MAKQQATWGNIKDATLIGGATALGGVVVQMLGLELAKYRAKKEVEKERAEKLAKKGGKKLKKVQKVV